MSEQARSGRWLFDAWRAEYGKLFWYVNSTGKVTCDPDYYSKWCDDLYELGNYFETQEEAEAKAKQIRDIFRGELT